MKHMKKLLALALVLVMISSLAISASAASITIAQDTTYQGNEATTTANGGRVFTYSQIFRATLSGTNESTGGGYKTGETPGDVTASLTKGISYYLKSTDTTQIAQLGTWNASNSTWTKASGNNWFKLTPSADGTIYVVEWENSATDTTAAQAAAKWLSANYTALNSGSLTWNSGTKKWTKTGLEDGYYLISSDSGANLVAATGDININEKNSYPPLIKEFDDETAASTAFTGQHSDEASSKDDTVQIGDTVTYRLSIKIPGDANQAMVITDSYTSGLDPVLENGVVKVTASSNFSGTATSSAPTAERKFTISLTDTDVIANAGKTVYFTYQAVVTKDAWYQTEINTGELKYGNNYTTVPDHVDSVTYNLTINKKNGSTSGDSLEGAQFELYRTDTQHSLTKVAVNLVALTDAELAAQSITKATKTVYYRVADKDDTTTTTTIDMTEAYDAVIYGLDGDSTYSIRETVAPPGFNKLEGDVDVVMNKANQVQPIVNNAGTVLPSTGGIGTTLFYVIGSVLVLAAGIVLVTKRRVQE